MADRALTVEAVLAGLQDITLPQTATGGLLTEVLVAIGLGLLLAAFGTRLLQIVTLIKAKPIELTLAQQVAALQAEPNDLQQTALLHLLKLHRPKAFARLRDTLYAPGGIPDLAQLRTEVLRDD